jgi:hypothetical protein
MLKDSLLNYMGKYKELTGNEHQRRSEVETLTIEADIRQLGRDVVAQIKELQASNNHAVEEKIPY